MKLHRTSSSSMISRLLEMAGRPNTPHPLLLARGPQPGARAAIRAGGPLELDG